MRETPEYPFDSMTDLAESSPRPEAEFGAELGLAEPLGIGPVSDVVVVGDALVAVGPGSLTTLTTAGEVVGRLEGLGPLRQAAVLGDVLVVTARHAGAVLIDVSELRRPSLISTYDTLEFATGVAAAGSHIFVTNRHYGLEVVDVHDPRRPTYDGSVLTGEAQSVAIDGATAYVGTWFDKRLVVVDVEDPERPRVTAAGELDGFGDGVAVRDGVCAVATGHHDGRVRDPRHWDGVCYATPRVLADGFGAGHGIELWDVSAGEPRLLSRLKTPQSFVTAPDTWRVVWAGDRLIHSDAHNGVFVVDASVPTSPVHVGFVRLPAAPAPTDLRSPMLQQVRHAATGIAVVDDALFVASSTSDLYRVGGILPGARLAEPERDSVVVAPRPSSPSPRVTGLARSSLPVGRFSTLLATDHQVHDLTLDGDTAVVACGTGGLALVDLAAGHVSAQVPSQGIAQHVTAHDGHLVVSEGVAGVSVWRIEHGDLSRVGVVALPDVVRQVVAEPGQALALAVAGANGYAVIDLSEPSNPTLVALHPVGGLVYARLIPEGRLARTLAVGLSQGDGVHWFDLSDPDSAAQPPRKAGRRMCPITEGAAVLGDRLLVVHQGGYYLLGAGECTPHARVSLARVPGAYLSGTPWVFGSKLLVINRATGSVRVVDVEDVGRPRLVGAWSLPGTPGRPHLLADGSLLVPCGHAGLLHVTKPW